MRVTGQPSGNSTGSTSGRGEWELAGTQGSLSPRDLVDRSITLELVPDLRVATGIWLPSAIWAAQGKPRLRRRAHSDQHLYLILSAALLLPKPKRDRRQTSGGRLHLSDNDYSLEDIKFDVVSLDNNEVVISPTDLVLINSDEDRVRVDYVERMRLVLDLWAAARDIADNHRYAIVAALLRAHRAACHSGDSASITSVADEIRRSITNDGDPLEIYHQMLTPGNVIYSGNGVHREGLEEALADTDPRTPFEASRDRTKTYRLQATRGAAGARFRRDVRAAYRHSCLFSGDRLPKTSLTTRAGVEAAHILPWADYDLDVTSNGICLNRLCHWAFEEGIIRLDVPVLTTDPDYLLIVPDEIKALGQKGEIDLTYFLGLEGPIPRERLPLRKADWPNQLYLTMFNQSLVFKQIGMLP